MSQIREIRIKKRVRRSGKRVQRGAGDREREKRRRMYRPEPQTLDGIKTIFMWKQTLDYACRNISHISVSKPD